MKDLSTIRALVVAEAPASTSGGSWRRTLALLLTLHGVVVAASLALGVEVFGHPPSLRGGAPVALALAIAANVVVAMAPSAGRVASYCAMWLAVLAVGLHVSAFSLPSHAPLWADADCALAEVATAAVPFGVTLWLMRRFAYQARRSGAAAVGAGLVGLLVLDASCPTTGLAHVLVFHLAPAAALIGIGIALRRRLGSLSHVP